MRSCWKFLATLCVAVGLTLSVLIGTANAQRDEVTPLGGCMGFLCGTIINQSSVYVYGIRDFDDSGPKPGTEWRIVWPGERTPENQDWDGVWVPCHAKGGLWTWTPAAWYRVGWESQAVSWSKIHTNQVLYVEQQSC